MPGWILREATEKDVGEIVRMLHAAFWEYMGLLSPPSGGSH